MSTAELRAAPGPATITERRANVLVTVVVPVYNEQETIAELLDEVFATGCRKQVIVVDDGSTDQSAQRIAEWQCRSPNSIELLRHSVNRGKGAAIRTGLALARGVTDAKVESTEVAHGRTHQ